jgi:hypothetical protein
MRKLYFSEELSIDRVFPITEWVESVRKAARYKPLSILFLRLR